MEVVEKLGCLQILGTEAPGGLSACRCGCRGGWVLSRVGLWRKEATGRGRGAHSRAGGVTVGLRRNSFFYPKGNRKMYPFAPQAHMGMNHAGRDARGHEAAGDGGPALRWAVQLTPEDRQELARSTG